MRAQMRQFGIKQAEVELHFIWIVGRTLPRPVRQMYFTAYGLDAPQITDARTLGEIRKSGLKDKLEAEALAHVHQAIGQLSAFVDDGLQIGAIGFADSMWPAPRSRKKSLPDRGAFFASSSIDLEAIALM